MSERFNASASRKPTPALSPFIRLIWASEKRSPYHRDPTGRERLLPSGGMHLVFRLSDDPIRIFDSVEDFEGHRFNRGVIGGVRTRFYVKDVLTSVRSVGATLQPGVSKALFDVTADELAEHHTSVEDLWGHSATHLWERLQNEPDLQRQMDVLEAFLLKRLPRFHGIHPAIAYGLSRIHETANIGEIVERTGYSHRRFIELFRRSVGLPPRLYTRVLRFQNAFKLITEKSQVSSKISWVEVALNAGYSDQSHFNREFREFAGVSPSQYLEARTGDSLHVPITRATR